MGIFSGERLKELRTNLGLSQTDFAKRLGVSQPQVSKYEREFDEPGRSIVRRIAAFFNVSEEYLYQDTDDPQDFFAKPERGLPVFESACAGHGATPFENPVDFLPAPIGIGGDMWIIVDGDSMGPDILNGDTVLVEKEAEILPGDTVVAVVEGDAVVKRYQITEEGDVLLTSNDPRYPVIRANCGQFKVVGRVVATLRKLHRK